MTTTLTDNDKPYRGRRLTWREFYELRPDLRPANDNQQKEEKKEVA